MTVAFDASTNAGTFGATPDPKTWTHTPCTCGAPDAVLVLITQAFNSCDLINGTVSYGGVSLTKIACDADTGGEVSRSYAYFKAGCLCSGAQTVSVDHTGAAVSKEAVSITFTACNTLAVLDCGTIGGNTASPAVALCTGCEASLRYAVLWSGRPDDTDTNPISGFTETDFTDFGSALTQWLSQNCAASGCVNTGWTIDCCISDDVALVAVAIGECAPTNIAVAGAAGAPTGALGPLLWGVPTDGSKGASAGALALTGSFAVVGSQGAPSGALGPAQYSTTIEGSKCAPSGVLGPIQYSVSVNGCGGAPSGDLRLSGCIAVGGCQGAPSGAIDFSTAIQVAGCKCASSGALALTGNFNVSGSPCAPSGEVCTCTCTACADDDERRWLTIFG